MDNKRDEKVVIIGGGPAGLTAGYQLSKIGIESVVLEKDDVVGGISRTVNYRDYHFDIGGHRFFTKVQRVEEMWREVLSSDFLRRSRLSRIFYNGKFFNYPLRPMNALFGLGVRNSSLILLSYVKAQLFPEKPEDTFETWVSNRFGRRLYTTFFKTYTEKVWGIPCNQISAEWAAQRIKGLSLIAALKDALIKNNHTQKEVITTLIDEFDYPRKGPGMMWEKVADLFNYRGGQVNMGAEAKKLLWKDNKIEGIEVEENSRKEVLHGTQFISTMPIRELIHAFDPQVPNKILEAANKLNYRDFLTVAIIVNKRDVFPDNWIYIHEPSIKVGRIQNFKNWSPEMVPDPSKTCLGLEYFCFEGDGLWTMEDEDLIELGKRELTILGFINASEAVDGAVVRMPKAYPVYNPEYKEALSTIKEFLGTIKNLQLVGRNGMHRYNNQDHSMLTAMLAVENINGANHDLWAVNSEQEYLEEYIKEPRDFLREEEILQRSFGRFDKLGIATAIGSVSGMWIFLATLWSTIRSSDFVGDSLLFYLNQYFIGYSVTLKGAFIGFGYSFIWGFFFGWLFAYIRNIFVAYFIYRVKRRIEKLSFRDFIDHF